MRKGPWQCIINKPLILAWLPIISIFQQNRQPALLGALRTWISCCIDSSLQTSSSSNRHSWTNSIHRKEVKKYIPLTKAGDCCSQYGRCVQMQLENSNYIKLTGKLHQRLPSNKTIVFTLNLRGFGHHLYQLWRYLTKSFRGEVWNRYIKVQFFTTSSSLSCSVFLVARS